MDLLAMIKEKVSGKMTPGMGIEIIKSEIAKELNFEPEIFEIHFDNINKKIFFIIPFGNEKRKYPFTGIKAQMLIHAVNSFLKMELNKGQTVEYGILKHHSQNGNQGEIYYTEDGEKRKSNFNI